MSARRRTTGPLAGAILALALVALPPGAAGQDTELNPHTREGCLHCHKSRKAPAPGRTTIHPSREEPHAVVQSSCRSCHKEGKDDFWILVLPPAGERPAAPAAAAGEPPPVAARAGAAVPVAGEGEGFENSHDAKDCASCHERPAAALKQGSATPPKLAAQGVESFCRSCHGGVDRTHFPRGNTPRAGTTCLNCHRAHGRSLLYPALRDDFPAFLSDSAELNPHGGKIFCLACHPDTPQPGQAPTFRFPGSSLQLCRRCHAGVEHHPLSVKSTPVTWKMDFSRFPLEAEAVTCVTCHKPPECLGTVGRENPRFLRGGPYNAAEEFCARCHEGKKFSSLDPHDQMDESGEVYQKKCLYCHVTLPSVTAGPEGLKYTDALEALCVSCHQVGPHPVQNHSLPMTKAMLATLRSYEERRLVTLPLDAGDVVTCVTCHNPHERGLLKGAAGVGAGEEYRLRLTTTNEVCTPCHGRH